MPKTIFLHGGSASGRMPINSVAAHPERTAKAQSNALKWTLGRQASATPTAITSNRGERFRLSPTASFLIIGLVALATTDDFSWADDRRSPGNAATLDEASNDHAAFIAEASRRFDIPALWIREVMHAESAGDIRAVSDKGALGLMQVMPGTYAELRVRHALGGDIFDPHDNILAGTAYLREMRDLFGAPEFLAAYHAGPGRYNEYLTNSRPLPEETRRYVADLAPRLGMSTPEFASVEPIETSYWANAPLFVRRSGEPAPAEAASIISRRDDGPAARRAPSGLQFDRTPAASISPLRARSNGLFVARSDAGR
jgi:soluble lytic murein transglycosylase-like protein